MSATMKFGDKVIEIANPRNIQPVSADLFTEAREYAGIFCFSFAALVTDGEAAPRAEITARLRLTTAGAVDLRNTLDTLLKGMLPGKETAN